MNTVTSSHFPSYSNAVTVFSQAGRGVVSLESADAKHALLPPVEQAQSPQKQSSDDTGSVTTGSDKSSTNKGDEVSTSASSGEEARSDDEKNQQLEEIRALVARDREVRAHEQAHASVGGQYAGSPSYAFQTGPDGVKYAVGGEVAIALPSINGDPEQAIRAAEQVRRAALAPADPSGQDRSVAAQASQIVADARVLAAQLQREEQRLEKEQQQTVDQAETEREAERTKSQDNGRNNSVVDGYVAVKNTTASQFTVGGLLDQQA